MLALCDETLGASHLPAEFSRCADIRDDATRLECYDALVIRRQDISSPGGREDVRDPTRPESKLAEVETVPEKGAAATKSRRSWRGLGIRPYRKNYILPVTYNSRPNSAPFLQSGDDFELQNVEMKFQLSLEVPVWEQIMESDLDLYFAYTQLSFFQAYNSDYSAPFRDTAYEPELGLNWRSGWELGSWKVNSARLAVNHQSNGRAGSLSRSWNRILGQVRLDNGDLSLALRLWHRINENLEDDDNPDIDEFLGNGELYANYKLGKHQIGGMLRNPFEKAAVQLDWSYFLNRWARLYVQYYNGYGESLIDYNHSVNRIGVGFMLNSWP